RLSRPVPNLHPHLDEDFLHPLSQSQTSRVRLIFLQEQTVETTYNLLETKMLPRLEWDVTPRLTTYAFYRASLDLLSNVKPAIRLALSGPNQDQSRPSRAVISGLGFGVDWNGTDDLVNPTRGEIGRFSVDPVGVGGDVLFLRLIGEGRLYGPLLEQFGAAGRLRLGSMEPIDGSVQIPLYERFYAGGIGSVRGYARHRVGPLASSLLTTSQC